MQEQDPRSGLLQHHELNGALKRLRQSSDLENLRPLLQDLKNLLPRHFEAEEHIDGLFDSIERKAPRLSNQVQECREEHRHLLATLEELSERTAGLRRDTRKFLRQLRGHEAKETEMLNDSMYIDLGGGD